MDLALNNLQRLICHKPKKPTNQPTWNPRNVFTIILMNTMLPDEVD